MSKPAAILVLGLVTSVAGAYTLDTEHPLYPYMEGIYVFDNRADDGDNIAGTGTMVGTVEDGDGFDVPITQTFQSWYNDFGSAYTFCMWHGGWTADSWSPLIQIHSTADNHALILCRNGTGTGCALYHQNTQYLMNDLLLTDLDDPMMLSWVWAASDHVGYAYDGTNVIAQKSALVTPKTNCTDAPFAIGGTAMTVTRLYIFSTRLTAEQLGALEADPDSLFAEEGQPPAKVTTPDPADQEGNVPVDQVLGWAASEGAANYNVHLGPALGALAFVGNVQTQVFDPALEYGEAYQWRVDPNNEHGTTTGDVWHFTTETAPVEPNEPPPDEGPPPGAWRKNHPGWQKSPPPWQKR